MTSSGLEGLQRALDGDARLWQDFLALCDCGGRLAGSDSERASLGLVRGWLEAIDPARTRIDRVAYAGWRGRHARLTLSEDGAALACHPLVGAQSTPPQGLTAEVVDLGRGTREDFLARASEIAGRIAMVRHEYMFSRDHIHRRRKYGWALEHGAAGFLIASPFPRSGPVCGSSGRAGGAGIPALATDHESALRLVPAGARLARARIEIAGDDFPAEAGVAVLEIPGAGPSWVVLSAHLDGHDIGESAMDNASGVAVVVAIARAAAPLVAGCRRGLRVCLFNAEEWALAGSRQYLERMRPAERDAIALDINLDTVGGDGRLTALTSDFPALDAFARGTAAAAGLAMGTHLPLMPNSDHASFAAHGIPALRLVAGFDAPDSNVRFVLTPADTRDKVLPAELQGAARLAAALLWKALNAPDDEMRALRIM